MVPIRTRVLGISKEESKYQESIQSSTTTDRDIICKSDKNNHKRRLQILLPKVNYKRYKLTTKYIIILKGIKKRNKHFESLKAYNMMQVFSANDIYPKEHYVSVKLQQVQRNYRLRNYFCMHVNSLTPPPPPPPP